MLTAIAVLFLFQAPAPAYQAVFIRAAPGHLRELTEAILARQVVYQRAGLPRPILLRHSQGDHWDLMVLAPIGSLAEHFSEATARRWRDAARRSGFDDAAFLASFDRWVAWREELFVTGPPVVELTTAAARAGYFHLEAFQALAGKRDSLLTQRRMENDFLARIGRPTNFVFQKLTGASWDAFTLGFYRDLQHYAEPVKVSAEEEDRAAKAAGFESRAGIGDLLRRFIGGHHDTLGPVLH